MHKFKVGLIVDGRKASRYVADLIRQSTPQSGYSISHLIIYDFSGQLSVRHRVGKLLSSRVKLLRFIAVRFFSLVTILDKALLRSTEFAGHDDLVDLHEQFGLPELKIYPTVSSSGFVYTFQQACIEQLRAEGFDALIRCGSGILRGDILNCASCGVLSFHHGDNDFFRGGPAGFWETYYGRPETGFIIQQLTDELDGGRILLKGTLQTRWYYKLNQASVLRYANIHMHHILEKLASGGIDINKQPGLVPVYSMPLFSTPGMIVSAAYGCKLVYRIIIKSIDRLLGVRYDWGISIGKKSISNAALWKSAIVDHPDTHFLADPFLVEKANETFLICEEYSNAKKKAHISAFRINGIRKPEYLGPVLDEPFHLSFPFVFGYEDSYYMVPECFQSGQVRLYKAEAFPFDWKLEREIFTGISAADPCIIQFDGYWWLLMNVDSTGGANHYSELHAFYSDNPVSGEWRSHAANPIVFRSRGGRNAGIFMSGGRVYRAGQNQGVENYGESFTVYEIEKLTPKEYVETRKYDVTPDFLKGLCGTHHVSSTDQYHTVDFKQKKYFRY